LAAGEMDSPGKLAKIPALNKRLNTALSQEALEKLYERLMRIINLPVEEYLDNEEYAKDIESYNLDSILAPVGENNKNIEEEREQSSQIQIENKDINHKREEKEKKESIEEEKGIEEEGEPDDLMCNEVIF